MRFLAWVLGIVAAAAAVVFLIARFGIPNLVGSGQAFAGDHAVSTLRTLHWAERFWREGRYADADADGIAEFGTLRQLAAAAPAAGGAPIPTALVELPDATFEGEVLAAMGYCFRIDLPEGTDARERRFAALAWPAAVGAVGPQMYCVDQDENILQHDAGSFVGCRGGPPPGACPDPSSLPAGWSRWRNKTSVNPAGAP